MEFEVSISCGERGVRGICLSYRRDGSLQPTPHPALLAWQTWQIEDGLAFSDSAISGKQKKTFQLGDRHSLLVGFTCVGESREINTTEL